MPIVLAALLTAGACRSPSDTSLGDLDSPVVDSTAPADSSGGGATDSSTAASESGLESDTEPGTDEPAEELDAKVRRGDSIERLLVAYTEAINERRAEDAYELFTPALKERVPLDDLVDGTSTSFISRLSVAQVVFDPTGSATVIASFRTDQDPTLGRDGQSCSLWELEYRMVDLSGDAQSDGDWRIDQAQPLGGSPFPCPVVAPEPEEQEAAEPRPAGARPVVHLTLDDGPGPETELFLDLFEDFNIQATFFVNGNRIRGREDVTKRIVSDGHAIANHTHTHTHCNLADPSRLSPSALCSGRTAMDEIEDVQQIVAETTGVVPSCFRPPYGAQSNATKDLVASYGLANWLWDIDTNDWKFNANGANYSDGQAIAELDKAGTIRPSYGSEGVIILLHDGTASAPRMLRLLRTWLESNADDFDFKALGGC